MEFNQTTVLEAAGKLGMAPEVFTKFLLKDTPEAEVTPLLASLKGLEVFTPSEFTARIGNERSQAATEADRLAKGNTYGAIDRRTLKATGLAKNEGESTEDYSERAFKEKFGTKVEESAELQRLRTELTARETALATANTELESAKVAHATERQQLQINAKIDAPINALSINTTPEMLDAQRAFLKHMLFQQYDVALVDGKEQFTAKGSTDVKRDPKTAAPMTAAALIAEFAPTVVSLKTTSAGQGSGYKNSPQSFTSGSIDFSQFPTADDLGKALAKQGITAGSPEGGKIMKDAMTARPELFT